MAKDAEAFDRFGGAVGIDGSTVARAALGTGSWGNHGETLGKPGETRGKVGDFHDFHGNTWENMVKLCDLTGKNEIFS